MNELIAAFDRILYGMHGAPFGLWDLAAWTMTGLVVIPGLFFSLLLFASILVAVFTPVVAVTSAKDRQRDADFIAANTDRAERATIAYFSGKFSGDMTEFQQVCAEPQPVREPTPASETLRMSCLPLVAMAAAVFLLTGLGFACVRWIQTVTAG